MSYNYLPLDRTPTTFQQIKNLIAYRQLISITFAGYEAVGKCREYLDKKLADGNLYQSVNIGGNNEKLDEAQIEKLQYELLQTHANSVGELVPDEITKLMLALKVKSLSYGHSGVQNETIQRLMDLHNNDVLPSVYSHSSFADVCLPLIGMGEAAKEGTKYKGEELEKVFGWKPLKLKAKEALALISGTEFTSAYGIYCLVKASHLIKMGDLISAVSFEAFKCDPTIFDAQINAIRPQKGKMETAEILLKYLKKENDQQNTGNANNPVAFSSIAQIHGAVKDVFNQVLKIFIQEINSVTDNPSIFPNEDLIVNSGNSNAQPLNLNLDYFAIALTELGNISENRTAQLLSLPMFAVEGEGLNNEATTLQNIAVEMVKDNKELCIPVSIFHDHLEDVDVIEGCDAAIKCLKIISNLEKLLAIELTVSTKALDGQSATFSPFIQKLIISFKETIPLNKADNTLLNNIMETVEFVTSYKI